jgi:hypothetical protein
LKAFIAGVIAEVILLVVFLFLKDMNMFMKASGFIGLACLVIATIVIGMSNDNVRKRLDTVDTNKRKSRLGAATSIFLFGIPGNIAYFMCTYLIR